MDNLNCLSRMAERRLERLAGPASERLRAYKEPMDIVSESIEAVLEGARNPHQGRQVQPLHLQSLAQFMNFLQGVIQSRVNSEFKKVRLEGEHVSWQQAEENEPSVLLSTGENVANDAARQDMLHEMFDRLRESFARRPAMVQAVGTWEEAATTEQRIPKGELSHKSVHELRKRAQHALKHMAAREGLSSPTGTELLRP